MKTAIYILKIIMMVGAVIWLLCLTSCTKEYIQTPTCHRYLELRDMYDGGRVYLYTDTLWPNGRINNVACGDELVKLEKNVEAFEGCTTGWFVTRYKILN